MGRLRTALKNRKIYLDANIFIYTLEAAEPWVGTLGNVFNGLNDNEFLAVTSQLTLSECLVLPFKQNNFDLIKVYREALSPRDNLSISAVDKKVLITAAHIRAKFGLKLPDAIHAATALTQKCTGLLTNDPGFKRVSGLDIFVLSDWLDLS